MFDTVDTKILKSFEIIKKIGQGAYGQVWKVKNKKTCQMCALKKIYDAFRNANDAQKAYREIKYIEQFDHPNIIKFYSAHRSSNSKDIYLAIELMDADLNTALKNGVLKDIHKQFIFYQIANSLNYLHNAQLIHRDLKPSNILVNQNCQVKICDFGLVRSIYKEGETDLILTDNIATKWYRAPEILLSSKSYGKEADIWNIGCILAEMYLGKPIFQGNSNIEQIQKIIEVIGKPKTNQLHFIKNQTSLAILQGIQCSKLKSIKEVIKQNDKNLIDLLQRILQFNPKDRLTIDEIMKHPFVSRFKGKVKEKVPLSPIKIPFDSVQLSVDEYRNLLYSEIEQSNIFESNPIKGGTVSAFYDTNQLAVLSPTQKSMVYKSPYPSNKEKIEVSPIKPNHVNAFSPKKESTSLSPLSKISNNISKMHGGGVCPKFILNKSKTPSKIQGFEANQLLMQNKSLKKGQIGQAQIIKSLQNIKKNESEFQRKINNIENRSLSNNSQIKSSTPHKQKLIIQIKDYQPLIYTSLKNSSQLPFKTIRSQQLLKNVSQLEANRNTFARKEENFSPNAIKISRKSPISKNQQKSFDKIIALPVYPHKDLIHSIRNGPPQVILMQQNETLQFKSGSGQKLISYHSPRVNGFLEFKK